MNPRYKNLHIVWGKLYDPLAEKQKQTTNE